MELFQTALILIFCFLLRAIFIIAPTSDNYVHLWNIKRSSLNGFGSHSAFKSVFTGNHANPFLNNYIISLFPKNYQIIIAYFLNIFYDICNIFVIYLLSKMIFPHFNIVDNNQIIKPHLVATLLYGTTPILFPVSARLKAFGSRTFGNLMVLIYFIFFGIGFITNSYFYILSIISGIFIIVSSQFGMQVMVLFSILFSISYLDVSPLMVLVLVFLIGLLIKNFGIKEILKRKLNHYIWYFKNYKRIKYVSSRNKLSDFLFYPVYLFSNPRYFLELTFYKLSPIIVLYSVPTLVLLIIISVFNYELLYWYINNNEIYKYIFIYALSSVIVFCLVSIKWIDILGQAERYFEYSIGAIVILLVIIFYKLNYELFIFHIILFQLIVIILNFLISVRKYIIQSIHLEKDYKFKELITFLNSLENRRIISIATKLNFKLSLDANDSHKFYYHFITEGKIDGFKRMREDEIIYNFIKPDYAYFKEEYDIDTIVVNKSELEEAKQYGINYPFMNLKVIFENNNYIVYSI